MRKVVLGAYTSVDGYSTDEDNGMRDVMMSIDDPEQEEYFVSRLSEAGTLIMGRVSYEARHCSPGWTTPCGCAW